ncbi:MAG: hypothetical protein R3263_09630 [Myxococcota bacterium]|nr:hypothetical protein [Myxococcota bacterium]
MVWSSERGGRVDPEPPRRAAPASGDGVARVRREVSGRRGKTVTTVSGVPLDAEGLRALAAELKRRCGSGGAVKDGVIEIQGDHRDAVVEALEARGLRVKRAGG